MSARQLLFGSLPLIRLGKLLWPAVLSLRDNVDEVMVDDRSLARLRALHGKRTVICPTHPSEPDGDVMFMLSRLTGEYFHFVAAKELFATFRELYGWLMTVGGCHSVRR